MKLLALKTFFNWMFYILISCFFVSVFSNRYEIHEPETYLSISEPEARSYSKFPSTNAQFTCKPLKDLRHCTGIYYAYDKRTKLNIGINLDNSYLLFKSHILTLAAQPLKFTDKRKDIDQNLESSSITICDKCVYKVNNQPDKFYRFIEYDLFIEVEKKNLVDIHASIKYTIMSIEVIIENRNNTFCLLVPFYIEYNTRKIVSPTKNDLQEFDRLLSDSLFLIKKENRRQPNSNPAYKILFLLNHIDRSKNNHNPTISKIKMTKQEGNNIFWNSRIIDKKSK